MANEWKWLSDRLDKVDQKIDENNQTLVRLTVTVEEHVRRTNLLEEKIQSFEEMEFSPIKRKINMVEGMLALIMFTLTTLGILRYYL